MEDVGTENSETSWLTRFIVDGIPIDGYVTNNKGVITFSTSVQHFEIQFKFLFNKEECRLEQSFSGLAWQAGQGDSKATISGQRYYPSNEAEQIVAQLLAEKLGPETGVAAPPTADVVDRVVSAQKKVAMDNLSSAMDLNCTMRPPSVLTVFGPTDGKADVIFGVSTALIALAAGGLVSLVSLNPIWIAGATAATPVVVRELTKLSKNLIQSDSRKLLEHEVAVRAVDIKAFIEQIQSIVNKNESALKNPDTREKTRDEIKGKMEGAYVKEAKSQMEEVLSKSMKAFRWSWKKNFKTTFEAALKTKYGVEISPAYLDELIKAHVEVKTINYQEVIEKLQAHLLELEDEKSRSLKELPPLDEAAPEEEQERRRLRREHIKQKYKEDVKKTQTELEEKEKESKDPEKKPRDKASELHEEQKKRLIEERERRYRELSKKLGKEFGDVHGPKK